MDVLPVQVLGIVFKLVPTTDRHRLLNECLGDNEESEFIAKAILLFRHREGLIIRLNQLCASDKPERARKFMRVARITTEEVRSAPGILLTACKDGNLPILQELVSIGLTVRDLRGKNDVALCSAINRERTHIFNYFIQQGLKINDIQESVELLDSIARSCNVWIVRKVLHMGITLSDLRYNKNLLLRTACEAGKGQIVLWLLELGITAREIVGHGALNAACTLGQVDVVRLLLTRLTVQHVLKSGVLCLRRTRHPQVIKCLINTGLTVDDLKADNGRIIKNITGWKNPEGISVLLESGITIEDIYNADPDALSRAVSMVWYEQVQVLKGAGFEAFARPTTPENKSMPGPAGTENNFINRCLFQ